MKRENRRGPELLPALPSPARLQASDLRGLENRRDIAILDTRTRHAFFEGHLAGSLLTELDFQFCSIAGSYVPEGTPIYLLVSDAKLVEAVRALIRVGLDRIVGHFTPETLAEYGRLGGALRRTTTIDMADLEKQRTSGSAYVLDVRGAAEFETGHVPDALHVPHTRIGINVDNLPVDKPLLVIATAVHAQLPPSRCSHGSVSMRST